MSASRLLVPLLAFAVALAWSAPGDARGRGGGGGAARASAHGSVSGGNVNRGKAGNANRGGGEVNRSTNVNRSTTVNSSREVNVEGDNDHWNDWDDHPVAKATAVTATVAAIGSIVYSVPPSCVNTVVEGTTYMQCGSTWYMPQYAGSNVQYVVVSPP